VLKQVGEAHFFISKVYYRLAWPWRRTDFDRLNYF